MQLKEQKAIIRSPSFGFIMRLLGLKYSGLVLNNSGISLKGGKSKAIAFSDLDGLLTQPRKYGVSGIRIPVKDDSSIIVWGLRSEQANEFISSANDALKQYVSDYFETHADEMQALSKVVDRLQEPNRYPSACLLAPFLKDSKDLMREFPASFPDGLLSSEQENLLLKIKTFHDDPVCAREKAIQKFITAELEAYKAFFDSIESNPLTPEQRLSLVTDEDATLTLAGAGSGKTSVIVAKAAYLISRGIRKPEEILLMAFGKDAADEMAERIKERTGASVEALTFHALGYGILKDVEGTAPALAAHASDDAQLRILLKSILLNDVASIPALEKLLVKWFLEFYWPYKSEWDFDTQSDYYRYVESNELRTFKGELVKSFEELLIANWLFQNGIAYEYEPLYEHEQAENKRRAYTPDFKLVDCGVYIEHFGVRKAKGTGKLTTAPHIDCERYLADMTWKRDVHEANETVLIETYSYERVEGRLLESLEEKLAPYVKPAPISQEDILKTLAESGQVDSFTQTLGTFLKHFKSSGTTLEACYSKVDGIGDIHRANAFLKVFEAVYKVYQGSLGKKIDFEDMIARATDHVRAGRYQSPYKHLLVDEFQDISQGRADLLCALKDQHTDARIFSVGDDWQAIYRFAGSDIHLMRNFGKEFGGSFADSDDVHSVVDLGRTFRSVDKIALPARAFVLKNPSQISKKVETLHLASHPAIKVAYYTPAHESAVIKNALEAINSANQKGANVLMLGRYHFIKPKNFTELSRAYPNLNIRFMTVHASKGLEADHVVVLKMATEKMGFPSDIVDDPVLDLVLPVPENFPHAEERRLFYVALTRAKKSVTILADRESPSVFVQELLDDPEYDTILTGEAWVKVPDCPECGGRMLAQKSQKGSTYYTCEHKRLCGHRQMPCSVCESSIPYKDPRSNGRMHCTCGAEFAECPECSDGWLVERQSRYGKFLGCVNYPACDGKSSMK
ncbi:MAG TPA: helicase IV [Micavibrio sp.]|nr:helicase IV [Micavibrio sp.]